KRAGLELPEDPVQRTAAMTEAPILERAELVETAEQERCAECDRRVSGEDRKGLGEIRHDQRHSVCEHTDSGPGEQIAADERRRSQRPAVAVLSRARTVNE